MTIIPDYTNLPQTVQEARNLKSKYYYTGIPCLKGHLCIRRTADRSCKECGRLKTKDYSNNNREKVRLTAKNYRKRNLEKDAAKSRRWQKNNLQKVYKKNSEWAKRNRDKTRAWYNFRKCKHQTISHLFKKEINLIYKQCKEKCLETNQKYEVDHIVPLKGKNVSGLHVPWNLQIITKEENLLKRNHFSEL